MLNILIIKTTMQITQCSSPLSPLSPFSPKFPIKKESFIISRSENIHDVYYFNQKPIGKGGYGTVYKAKLISPPYHQRVVKVISKKLVPDSSVLQNQIHILKMCDHPNIVKLYETFEDNNNLYLVLDFCEGGELFDRLDDIGPFSEDYATEIFIQMLQIIKYLHAHKICHRDLKAQNFLFSHQDTNKIKLIDFGLAYNWHTNMQMQMELEGKNKIVGTAYYVAPEVLKKQYDEKCDIWGLGILLYILVTGTAPFNGHTDDQIIENIRQLHRSENPQQQFLSSTIKDLISKILSPAHTRISLQEIMNHDWVKQNKNHRNKSNQLKIDYRKFRSFAQNSKLKSLVIGFIASQIPESEVQCLGNLFKQIDTDGDGYLTIYDLQRHFKETTQRPSSKELKKIFKAIDLDKDSRINYNEFISCLLPSQYLLKNQYQEFAFRTIDSSHDGQIDRAQLCNIINSGELNSMIKLRQKLISEIMIKADKNHDGRINFEQFRQSLLQN